MTSNLANKILSKQQMLNAVECAKKVTQVAINGAPWAIVGVHHFDLLAKGRCQETVREFIEAGNGWGKNTWEFGNDEPSAKVALQHMDAAGLRLPDGAQLYPGDIVGNRNGSYGHIGLYIGVIDGVPTVAENTSSASRGKPRRAGTKRTPLVDFKPAECYRLVQSDAAGVFVDGKQIYPTVLSIGAKSYVPRRLVAQALGLKLESEGASAPTVNGTAVHVTMHGGISWIWAREIAQIAGIAEDGVLWEPGRVEFISKQ